MIATELMRAANDGPEALQQAMRKLSLKHHPDRGGDPKEFARIQSQYERTLKLYRMIWGHEP